MTNRAALAGFLRLYGMLLILIVLIVALGILQPRALNPTNVLNLARQISITALVSAGQTLVILAAQIDLSVGSVLGLAGVIAAGVLRDSGSAVLAVLAGLAVGAACGWVNGVIVAKGKVAAFIVTLATLGIANGIVLIYTGARPIAVENDAFAFLGEGKIDGIPFPIILAAIVYVLLWVVLNKTPFGRYNYAIGGNELATRLAGIPVDRYKIYIFVSAGVLAGLTGIVLTARLGSGVPTLGTGFELISITAVVLGGTSLFGGEGKIWGTLVGAAITGIIANGLSILGVGAYYQPVVTGVVIVLAVLADRWLRVSSRR
jgi:ribose/xylose/arabinose/galactoside ABC-type transport system permease subunit